MIKIAVTLRALRARTGAKENKIADRSNTKPTTRPGSASRTPDASQNPATRVTLLRSQQALSSQLIIATLDGFPVVDDDSRGAGSAARPPAKALGPFLGQPGAVRARALPIKRPASRKPPHIAPVEAHVAETAAAALREGGRTRKTAARRHQAALSTSDG